MLRPANRISVILLGVLFTWNGFLSSSHAEDGIDFDRQIRPLLSDNCFSCHGPDAAQRQAELRLDRREDAVKQGAIQVDRLEESELIQRILSDDPKKVMPPPESNKKLTDQQKKLLQDWLKQGAKYTQHWSFQSPVKTQVAVAANESMIDTLVERVLKQNGLSLSKRADPHTLARRLAFDLIGLPPTTKQLEQLQAASASSEGANGEASAKAVNHLIDELLDSPHYGERMAIGWLDVVRFADTIGYHSDTPRNVYPYRDYVINSFNANKRFDLFTTEQIAGDLLPDATAEQKVASCFNRLLLTTEEGGAQPKDYESRYLADRVRAIGTVWLGMTIGCAQCHDHKFDPFTMKDFYSLGAFFADIDEAIIGKREEGMFVPTQAQANEMQLLKAEIATLQAELAAEHPQLAEAQRAWEQEQLKLAQANQGWVTIKPTSIKSNQKSKFTVADDHSILVSGKRPDKDVYSLTFENKEPSPKSIVALRLEALPHASLPAKGSGRADNGNFVLTEVIVQVRRKSSEDAQRVEFKTARASIEQTVAAEKHPDKRWSAASAIDQDVNDSSWGWAILPDVTKPQQLQILLSESLVVQPGDSFTIEMRHDHGNKGHNLGNFRWSITEDARSFEAPLVESLPPELLAILRTEEPGRKAEQQQQVRVAYQKVAPALEATRKSLARAEKRLSQIEASVPKCLITKQLAKPRLVRILPRGNWQDESGPVMTPRLPEALNVHSIESNRPLNRLDLARWLTDKTNPLTARVFMNRLWKQFFGAGLARNLDDLGAQGEAPVHRELLDYLAIEFQDSGWDIKHMVRLIVSSRTYQQSSHASAELMERDPENRLLARQSRFRLPAELVRDNALEISGLLVRTIGGPSIKPYQPEGYWENLNFPPRNYVADSGPTQHRRGLYVWWQRSFVHPSMLEFDAPTREECAADRSQSNIPQQALVLLNDPTYVEAARGLAKRMQTENHSSAQDRISWAFHLATSRTASANELNVLKQLYDESLKDNGKEEQAYFQVARAILNVHEVITRN